MPDLGRFLAHQLGCSTTKMRQGHRIGQLIAVFRSSFYVEFADGMCCIGHENFNSGPLNIITDVPASVDWRQCGLEPGDKVWITNDKISVGQSLQFSTKNAVGRVWYPSCCIVKLLLFIAFVIAACQTFCFRWQIPLISVGSRALVRPAASLLLKNIAPHHSISK